MLRSIALLMRMYYALLSIGAHFLFFFFNDTATTEIYTLSLHDALPISYSENGVSVEAQKTINVIIGVTLDQFVIRNLAGRSEEHTSELQSHSDLVCRLLLEKKKQNS